MMKINASVKRANDGLSQITTSLSFLYNTRTISNVPALRRQRMNGFETVASSTKNLRYGISIKSRCYSKHKSTQKESSSTSGGTVPNDSQGGGTEGLVRRIMVSSYQSVKDGWAEKDRQAESRTLGNRKPDHPKRRGAGKNLPVGGHKGDSGTDRPSNILAEEDIPWNRDPRENRTDKGTVTSASIKVSGIDEGGKESVPWVSDDPFVSDDNDLDVDNEHAEYSDGPSPRFAESTITIAERLAFDRIFEELLRSRQSSATGPAYEQEVRTDNEAEGNVGFKTKSALKIRSSDSIESSSDVMGPGPKEEEVREAVDRFPPALRAKAAEAMGLASASDNAVLSDSSTDTSVVDGFRQQERDKVEVLMRAAGTDAELWQVMEREVFSIVKRLGFEEKVETKDKNRRARKSAKVITTELAQEVPVEAASEKSVGREDGASVPVQQAPSDLTIYGPLYPEHLLLALRLLDRSFRRPSPLVQNILPRIKSLGLVSQVLGASTALYNELLRIAWFRMDNFDGVLATLHEMEAAGLDLDSETLDIVNDIITMQTRVNMGLKGAALKALWQMPDFAPGKFDVWRDKIREGIMARESESSMWADAERQSLQESQY